MLGLHGNYLPAKGLLNILAIYLFVMVLLAVTSPDKDAQAESILGSDRQYVHAYFGQMSNFSLAKAVSFQDWNKFGEALPSFMIAVGGGLDYYFCDKILSLGVEVDYASHWGKNDIYTGEVAVAVMGRLNANEISKYIPFYIGVGNGLSYAIGIPRAERRYGYGISPSGREMKDPLLNFLILEFGIPIADHFELFARIHHRCTMFGLFDPNGKKGGVNYPSVGIRYYF
ncbi:MAG: hypothetical protein AB7U59_13325 [Desulfovibrionaceae bacterium]